MENNMTNKTMVKRNNTKKVEKPLKKYTKAEIKRNRAIVRTVIGLFLLGCMIVIPFLCGMTQSRVNVLFITMYLTTLAVGGVANVNKSALLTVVTSVQVAALLIWLAL